MDRIRGIWHVVFLVAPVTAGVFGYRYQGWLGGLVYPIAALAMLGFVMVGALIFSTWIKYLRDRRRISQLPVDQLRRIVAEAANVDFRFAFAELKARGIDVATVQQSLLAMLASRDGWERQLGLERFRDIYPELRHVFDEPTGDSPGKVQARVRAILERNGYKEH
jgi:hypothetical protein